MFQWKDVSMRCRSILRVLISVGVDAQEWIGKKWQAGVAHFQTKGLRRRHRDDRHLHI
ncbi:hypothetical protein [Paraburkholderia sabiae]|uniref:hypothetical protein n=1 Tax=Paraburkholderia sabiae TaxID=273251 RepID=UPI001CC4964D|nr:hypothetical protein [Paraburkholderia sabiae]